jgi:hypothetical protein
MLKCHVFMAMSSKTGRQTEMHKAEPFVPEPEVTIRKLKRYELPDVD